ncbi:unnamed protein product [Adineta steineri]|uniref:Uncharacterized protein n=1 Tax=Adineta steineri TaxID=433720 RepID=A0A816A393_9BILA|nr:unnamed protein product [Adineta steineri]CAF1592135.1 unnamed protein product [Adineta steineri]
MQRPTTFPSMEFNNERDPFDDHPLFTPDLEYFTPPTMLPLIDDNRNAYCPRTLTPYNIERHTILPVFPPCLSVTENTIANDASSITQELQPPLLLCNVPKQQLSQLQLVRRTSNIYLSSYEFFEKNLEMIDSMNDSFLVAIYRQLLYDLSIKWQISIPLLDYNLARLNKCTRKCLEHWQQQQRQDHLQLLPRIPTTATFTIEELPSVLEFYLQIDVDLFYLKTCSFRQAEPIENMIFCSKPPEIHYCLTACNKFNCSCCHPLHARIYPGQSEAIQFNIKQKYQFVNGYQTILNCPATCETSNIIYVLTCPCQQFDYVGVTNMSFRDCLAMHRNESNRILREFILGPTTTSRILQGIKSEKARRNDGMRLYQHTSRCPQAIQLFLDANPDYWCLVPMTEEKIEINNSVTYRSTSMQLTSTRPENDAKYLVENLPVPPELFHFTDRQQYEQICFFQEMKDELLHPRLDKNVDLYNATIVAVLPENCSEMFQQLILSLFITHADCQLNKSGRLITDINFHPYPVRRNWCAGLCRRPLLV